MTDENEKKSPEGEIEGPVGSDYYAELSGGVWASDPADVDDGDEVNWVWAKMDENDIIHFVSPYFSKTIPEVYNYHPEFPPISLSMFLGDRYYVGLKNYLLSFSGITEEELLD